MSKKKRTDRAQTIVVCTCRVANYDWIKERKLYNLPLPAGDCPSPNGRNGRARSPSAPQRGARSSLPVDHGYSAVTHVIVYARDLPALAYSAKYVRDVDADWLAANGYGRAYRLIYGK